MFTGGRAGVSAFSVLILLLFAPRTGLLAQEAPGTGNAPANSRTAQSSPAPAGGEISGIQLVGLPLNGRSYSQLATLQAGVSDPSAEQSSRGGGGGNLTVSGGRASSNNFLLDGTNIMDTDNRVPRSAAGVQLGSDAVLQVQVLSANYGAEYGRSSGGVLNSITRSGTEQFHGTLFEYLRNSKLDARNFFDPETPPPFKRNQFGFTLTGPVRKNGTFFMGSWEALRDRLTETFVHYFPDAEARQGIITDAAGNVIQSVTVAPSVKPYLALYPLPNGSRVGRGSREDRNPQFLPSSENFFTLRLDHKISDPDSFFARYTFDDAVSDTSQGSYLWRTRRQTRQQYFTLVESHIFNPRVLGSLRFGFTRPLLATETLAAIEISPSLFFVAGAPQFGQIFHPGLTPFGPNSDTPASNLMHSFQSSGDLGTQQGAHALKFGVEIHRYRWHVSSSSGKSGIWHFNSLENYLTAGAGGGVNVSVALPGSDNTKNYRQTLLGFYLQDGYAVSPRLQLNLGLRYELATLLHDKDGKTAFLEDPWHDSAVQVGPYLAHNPSRLGFSPRVGFTWSPLGGANTVVRGGFGIYYDQLLAYVVDSRKDSVPFHKAAARTNFDSSSTFPDAVAAVNLNPIPFQAQIMDYRGTTAPVALRYSFALQQQLPGGWRFQSSYVGARGNHLFRSYEANLFPIPITRSDGSLFFPPDVGPINPAFAGGIDLLGSDAQSFYNSLQLSAGKSLWRGLSFQANYTWSKSVDDASTIGPAPGTPQTASPPFGLIRTLDRGLSDFDSRHRLAVSYFYTVPSGSGQRGLTTSGLLARLLGGWRLGGIVSVRSGTPFTPAMNISAPGFLFSPARANLLPGRSNNPVQGLSAGCERNAAGRKLGGPNLYYDPCAFGAPPPGTLGNLGRNTVISASVYSLDLSLQKEFLLSAQKRLQFRAEVFNLPNHPNFNRVMVGSLNTFSGFPPRLNPTAGFIQSTVTTSRQIQFALRLSF